MFFSKALLKSCFLLSFPFSLPSFLLFTVTTDGKFWWSFLRIPKRGFKKLFSIPCFLLLFSRWSFLGLRLLIDRTGYVGLWDLSIVIHSSEMSGQESATALQTPQSLNEVDVLWWGWGIDILIEKPFPLAWSRSNVHGMSKPGDNLEICRGGLSVWTKCSLFYTLHQFPLLHLLPMSLKSVYTPRWQVFLHGHFHSKCMFSVCYL